MYLALSPVDFNLEPYLLVIHVQLVFKNVWALAECIGQHVQVIFRFLIVILGGKYPIIRIIVDIPLLIGQWNPH